MTKIAKTVQMDRDTVKTAAAAGRSQTALDALDNGQLDLEQAAIVATFFLMWTFVQRVGTVTAP